MIVGSERQEIEFGRKESKKEHYFEELATDMATSKIVRGQSSKTSEMQRYPQIKILVGRRAVSKDDDLPM